MVRRDVPYPGGKCSLKCELENMWRILRGKLRSVNNVTGDGNGNVTLEAGANVTITDDPDHNKIMISAEDAVGIAKINNTNPDSSGNFGITGDTHITVTAQTNGTKIGTTGLATSTELGNVINGTTPVQQATHATSADSQTSAGHATSADSATTATSATSAGTAASASEAAKLSTARSIKTDLASTSAQSFDGSTDVTPGVSGVLPIANGGTGSNTQNFLGNYGDQTLTNGKLTIYQHAAQYYCKTTYLDVANPPSSTQYRGFWQLNDKNDVNIGAIAIGLTNNGAGIIQTRVRNQDGTIKYTTLIQGN